jgi:hypothetical protein
MTEKEIIKKLWSRSFYLDVIKGNPPEDAVRLALEGLFLHMAREVKNTDISSAQWYPMDFPMRLTLSSEQVFWDFRLSMKLEIEEHNDGE